VTELTVCMVVYNGGRHLKTSIGSLLGQTLQDFKLLIYDDGSTDDTLKVIESFHDDRFRVIKGGVNQGILRARSKLIPLIDTEYCMWLDDDDFLCREDALEHGLDVVKSKNFDIATFARMKLIHRDGTVGFEPYCQGSDFEYFGDRLFETHYPTPMHCYLTSKIIRSSIMKESVPEKEILDGEFISEDSFYSTMLFYLAKSYRHIESEQPIYAYNCDIGVWGSKRESLVPSVFDKECKVAYNVVKSVSNRMPLYREPSQKELENLVMGVHVEELLNKIERARNRFGRAFGDELCCVWRKWFCADGVHVLNGVGEFAMPEYVRSLERRLNQ